jgi:hypothetical protein
MEPLWSPVVATGGNQRQIGWARKHRKQAKTIAACCGQLPREVRGKDGVDGSSASEGSAKSLHSGLLFSAALALCALCGRCGGAKPRTLMLTSQNRELVAQQHQLHVLGELGAPTATEQPQNGSEGKISERAEHRAILPGPVRADRSCAVQRFLVFARVKHKDERKN